MHAYQGRVWRLTLTELKRFLQFQLVEAAMHLFLQAQMTVASCSCRFGVRHFPSRGSSLCIVLTAGRGSHANYPHPGTHGRIFGMADDHNDEAGVLWNARAALVEPWPYMLLRFGGRLSKHVVNVWQQVLGLSALPGSDSER